MNKSGLYTLYYRTYCYSSRRYCTSSLMPSTVVSIHTLVRTSRLKWNITKPKSPTRMVALKSQPCSWWVPLLSCLWPPLLLN